MVVCFFSSSSSFFELISRAILDWLGIGLSVSSRSAHTCAPAVYLGKPRCSQSFSIKVSFSLGDLFPIVLFMEEP